MRKLIIVSLLFLIPLICYCQTKNQLAEIKNRGLNINNLKTISGKLNLNKGDGYSYKTFKKGDYSNKKYLNEVYAFYAGKVYMTVKKSPITKLTSDRMNQFLIQLFLNLLSKS
jgi:hypothetical protein